MERRDWSLKALKELQFLDSLDDQERADGLVRWGTKYISNEDESLDFDLEIQDLERLSELYYKNLQFLKNYKNKMQDQMRKNRKMQTFLKNG
ncbi:hypothetical protein [Candidatus Marinarcus aquaticus]|uniref:Uncharacterized protein n=1 Tax=Candidatus Marinarcus aquaticus TaxID=2044504 RepID=A0A4Q0XQP6_9BACT|nr:hypothetical protein [Candidatus Marinarcus aquaticus]RXJ56379.1 hypothetical protein CRV04_08155 [Candidatus Marinarcus aquaticus]